MSNTLNIELSLDTTLNFDQEGFTFHAFIDVGGLQTESESQVKLSYDSVINYNLESALVYPHTENELLDPNSIEGLAIKEEIDGLKSFIQKYEKRVDNAIENFQKENA